MNLQKYMPCLLWYKLVQDKSNVSNWPLGGTIPIQYESSTEGLFHCFFFSIMLALLVVFVIFMYS